MVRHIKPCVTHSNVIAGYNGACGVLIGCGAGCDSECHNVVVSGIVCVLCSSVSVLVMTLRVCFV